MTKDEFKQLEVGDIIYHPYHGEMEIVWVEKLYDFEATDGPPYPEYTYSFEIAGGYRMKIGDYWDLPRTRVVSKASDRGEL